MKRQRAHAGFNGGTGGAGTGEFNIVGESLASGTKLWLVSGAGV